MNVAALIEKLEAMPLDKSVYFWVDGYAEEEHRTIETVHIDDEGDVVIEGTEA